MLGTVGVSAFSCSDEDAEYVPGNIESVLWKRKIKEKLEEKKCMHTCKNADISIIKHSKI